MDHRQSLCIGRDVGVRLFGTPVGELLPAASQSFSAADGCQLTLEVVEGSSGDLGPLDLLFDSTSLWRVQLATDGQYVFDLPHLRAVVDFAAGQGRIYRSHAAPGQPAFDYPLDEVIFSKLLAEHDSVIAHACGVACGGRGILFGGGSGAGKSTLAGLFANVHGAQVLSDDRVALGIRNNQVHISGTPWHGTAGHALNETVALERIFFLRQAPRNQTTPLRPEESASRLLSLCVIPYWHRESAQKAVDTAAAVAEQLPALELGFVPDASVVEYATAVETWAHA